MNIHKQRVSSLPQFLIVVHYGRVESELVQRPCCRIAITVNTNKLMEDVYSLQFIVSSATHCKLGW